MSTFNSKNLSEEQVRRLINARVKAIQRKKASKVFLCAATKRGDGTRPGGLHYEATRAFLRAATDHTYGTQPGRIDEGVIQMFQDALLSLEDATAKLPKGFPHEPGSWEVLEDLLGKDIVDGWRK